MVGQTIQDLARSYRAWYEEVWFSIYTLLLIMSAIGISQELVEAAEASGGIEGTLSNLLGTVNLDVVDLGAFVLGLHLCLLAVLFLDHKKRMQSILIAFGTVIGLLAMLTGGVFFVWFDSIKLVIMLFGFLTGTLVADWSEIRRIKIGDPGALARGKVITGEGQDPIEFPRAELALYLMLTFVVVAALIDANLQFPSLLVEENGLPRPNVDAVEQFEITETDSATAFGVASGGLFLVVLRMFLGYEADRSVVVLGPPGSGKTHFYLGLYRAATNHKMHPRDDYEVSRLQAEMRRSRNFVDRTRKQQPLGFTYTIGRYFPKDIALRANDYPGEYFYHIADGIRYCTDALTAEDYENKIREDIQEGKAIKEGEDATKILSQPRTDGGGPVEEENDNSFRENLAEEDETTPGQEETNNSEQQSEPARRREIVGNQIAPDVIDADLLVFVLDMKSKHQELEADPTGSVELGSAINEAEFKQILTALSEAGRSQDVKLVASKSDFLLDSFEEKHPQIEIWSSGTYDMFRQHINQSLSQGRGSDIKQRVREEAYPVFYKTAENDTQEDELVLDRGDPLLFGFDRVLRRLGR